MRKYRTFTWSCVTPTNDTFIGSGECDELGVSLLDVLAHESLGFRQWRRLEECQEPALACNLIEARMEAPNMALSDRDNAVVHCLT